MIIRKGTKEDMQAVLDLIIELAVFEKEPDAVVVTKEDLIRDGFSSNPLFHTFVAENAGNPLGEMLEWLKRHAWKACIRQKCIAGSNPALSAVIK